MSFLRRYLPLLTIAFAIAGFYLHDLNGVGVLGPDEPRYLAIGRAMARSGDVVTPRLWGSPWFEKPPLLYWMTAAGAAGGLGPELSGRLPVAVLSFAFLLAAFFLLRREFGTAAAAVTSALLGTCAGWIAYSSLALTDLPLAVFFSLAVFLVLPSIAEQPGAKHAHLRLAAAGVCIGLATLAKGLVPLALALPFFWFFRNCWKSWWIAIVACLGVALPWYIDAYLRNGYPFVQELFLKHHFERLYSSSLQHVQPWYYYVPVLLAALFPWTPLILLTCRRDQLKDTRLRFLAVTFAFGFVLFSVSLNKLPGYLLPLLPCLFTLIGAQFESRPVSQRDRGWTLSCALLICLVPLLTNVLPQMLSAGRLTTVTLTPVHLTEWFYIAVPLGVVLFARRSWRGALLVLCVVASGIYVKGHIYPILDRQISARGLWCADRDKWDRVCDGGTNRDWLYGLALYRGALFPQCGDGKNAGYVIHSSGRNSVALEPRK